MKKVWIASKITLLIVVVTLLAACSTAPFKPAPMNVDLLRQRADVQTFEPLTVKAAVPSAAESESLFGVPLYDKGVQPVWLEVTNRGDERVRLVLVSVDPDYFSPLEVSYTSRKGFSKEARAAMDKRFHNAGITRFIEPGETVSGFVFTHLSQGTKCFNVDFFSINIKQNFAFFIQVPGFVPDHAEVNFEQLYARDEIRELSSDEFRDALRELSVYTSNKDGEASGLPVNVAVVANGIDVLRALLRAGWYESIAASSDVAVSGQATYYLYGRQPDAVFRYQRKNSVDRNELRVWRAPFLVDGEMVWLGQITNFVGQRSYIEKLFYDAHLDPDVDDARSFLMQNIWYSQGLQKFAWSSAGKPVSIDQPGTDFNGNPFFTDGFRVVLWLSGMPYSLLDATRLDWDEVSSP
jgi:hypothetical protein